MMEINWKWPQTRLNQYLPWYLIIWRMFWTGPLIVAFAVYLMLYAVTFLSVREAKHAGSRGVSLY